MMPATGLRPQSCPILAALSVALMALGCSETNLPATSQTANSVMPPAVHTSSNVVPPITNSTVTKPSEQSAPGADMDPRATAAAPQEKSTTTPAPTPTNSRARIRLSAGVALAQTLPEGTTVLCSMDYEWIEGSPQQGRDYGWSVELGNGQRVAGAANVSKRRGTIQAVLHGVRPDQGPFKGAVFVKSPGASPEQISDFVSLLP